MKAQKVNGKCIRCQYARLLHVVCECNNCGKKISMANAAAEHSTFDTQSQLICASTVNTQFAQSTVCSAKRSKSYFAHLTRNGTEGSRRKINRKTTS